ncbi:MAG: hypothetical protein WBB48_11660 [Thermodesulfobacteriota bacterium]|jgi:hypothetical protein
MRLIKTCLLLIALIIFAFPGASIAQQSDLSPLGFKFGIDKGDAMKVIDSRGKRIVEDQKDHKDMRVILMQGVIVNLPIDESGKDVMTELEFYNKKLLSTSLVFAATDEVERTELETDFDKHFTAEYGDPVERDSMMYFTTTTWHIPDIMLILHTNSKNNTVKVEYKYKPGHQAKFEDELDYKRGTIKTDPATQMFLDGDYSKPTFYDDKYGTQ